MFEPCLQVTGASAPYVVAVPSAEIVPPTLRAVAGEIFEIPNVLPDKTETFDPFVMLSVLETFIVVAKRELKLLVAETFRVVDEMNGIVSVSKLKFVFVEFDVNPAANMFVVTMAFDA